MVELDKIKDEPWQWVTHAYYERWHIFMVLYFEMHLLPWFKAKRKEAKEDFSQPGTLYMINMMKVINRHVSRLPKKLR